MHFAEDCTLVEVEDERILVTNLFMRTQPVIRYEITDLVRVSDEPCPCGRPFRVVEAIEGRSDDILQLPGAHGRDVPVHPISLRSPLAKIGGLRQYQVVHRVDGLHVHAVPRNGATALADEVRAALEGALRAAGVTATPVHVDLVDALERDPGAVGKLKLVRSEVAAS
jgi:phenylacetate-coenzyme A ligase PaaK-like adenylate-forming protein